MGRGRGRGRGINFSFKHFFYFIKPLGRISLLSPTVEQYLPWPSCSKRR